MFGIDSFIISKFIANGIATTEQRLILLDEFTDLVVTHHDELIVPFVALWQCAHQGVHGFDQVVIRPAKQRNGKAKTKRISIFKDLFSIIINAIGQFMMQMVVLLFAAGIECAEIVFNTLFHGLILLDVFGRSTRPTALIDHDVDIAGINVITLLVEVGEDGYFLD